MIKTTVLRAAGQIAAALRRRVQRASTSAGASATAPGARRQVSRREQAARAAARLGIQVRDQDLQKVWQQEREAAQPKHQYDESTRNMEKASRPTPRQERPDKER